MARLLLSLGMAALFAACGSRERDLERVLRKTDPARLRHDAALVYKDALSSEAQGVSIVPKPAWPKSFLPLNPTRVSVYRDGVAVALSPGTDSESGLYIIPEGMEHRPINTARARFQPLRESIYLYDFGVQRH